MSVIERIALKRRLPRPSERRGLRVRVGLTMQEIADELNVTAGAVGQWERGERNPRGRNLSRYVEILETIRANTPEADDERPTRLNG